MGGVTLRKVCDAEVLQERHPALLTVIFNGYLNVVHLSVIVLLLSYTLVDKEKVHPNCGYGTTDTKLSTQAERLTHAFTGCMSVCVCVGGGGEEYSIMLLSR